MVGSSFMARKSTEVVITCCWRELMLGYNFCTTHPRWRTRAARESCASTTSFRLRRQLVNGQPLLEIDDRGDANAVLKNKAFLSDAAQRLVKRGVIPTEDGWAGWLGAYQRAIR